MLLSFEYFPPKTEQGLNALIDTAQALQKYKPDFFSVTYGAAGSMQHRTLDTVKTLQQHGPIQCVPHISCIGSTKENMRELLQQYKTIGVQHVLVLRGDLPSGSMGIDGDFKYAYELIEFIRKETHDYFFIEAAAYPEMHPETLNPLHSIKHLKMKADAGANRFITQYFYDRDAYCYLIQAAEKAGITQPIIPGIMPITNYTQLTRFSHMCGASIPRWLKLTLESMQENTDAITEFGIEFLTNFCKKLIAEGAPGLHFYTLNKAYASQKIIQGVATDPSEALPSHLKTHSSSQEEIR